MGLREVRPDTVLETVSVELGEVRKQGPCSWWGALQSPEGLRRTQRWRTVDVAIRPPLPPGPCCLSSLSLASMLVALRPWSHSLLLPRPLARCGGHTTGLRMV